MSANQQLLDPDIVNLSFFGKIFLIFISLISDLTFFMTVSLMKYQNRYFLYYILYFSFISLFISHLCYIFQIELFLNEKKWFQIFEIGLLTNINSIILSMNKLGNDLEKQEKICYIIFLLIMIFEKINPQIFIHKLYSIFISLFVTVYLNKKYGMVKLNSTSINVIKGGFFGILSLIFMYKSYSYSFLKIFHYLSIFCFGLFSFYFMSEQLGKPSNLRKILKEGIIIYPIEKNKTLVI